MQYIAILSIINENDILIIDSHYKYKKLIFYYIKFTKILYDNIFILKKIVFVIIKFLINNFLLFIFNWNINLLSRFCFRNDYFIHRFLDSALIIYLKRFKDYFKGKGEQEYINYEDIKLFK